MIAALCLLAMHPYGALALEGGGSHYFGGNEDFGAGSWPPPGLSANLIFGKGLLTLKAQFGVYAANRPDGTFLWLKYWHPIF